jgi:hypothetical protein
MARVYADVNQQMPRSYWDYDSVNITWGVLENYEVVRKIGKLATPLYLHSLLILSSCPYILYTCAFTDRRMTPLF